MQFTDMSNYASTELFFFKMATLTIMYNWHIIITNNKITFGVHQKKLIFQIPEMNVWPHSGRTGFSLYCSHKFSTGNNSAMNTNVLVTLRSSVRSSCHFQRQWGVHIGALFSSLLKVNYQLTFYKDFLSFFQITWLLLGHILSHEHLNQKAKKENNYL